MIIGKVNDRDSFSKPRVKKAHSLIRKHNKLGSRRDIASRKMINFKRGEEGLRSNFKQNSDSIDSIKFSGFENFSKIQSPTSKISKFELSSPKKSISSIKERSFNKSLTKKVRFSKRSISRFNRDSDNQSIKSYDSQNTLKSLMSSDICQFNEFEAEFSIKNYNLSFSGKF